MVSKERRREQLKEKLFVWTAIRTEIPLLFQKLFPNPTRTQKKALQGLLNYMDSRIAMMRAFLQEGESGGGSES